MCPRILKNEIELKDSLTDLSAQLNESYRGKQVEIIKMNSAADLFLEDLSKMLQFKFNIQSLEFKAHKDPLKKGVNISKDLSQSIAFKEVILIDGIIISGKTHAYLTEYLSQRKPKSLSIVCIGTKEESEVIPLPATYSMFKFKKEWVEGYGIGNQENAIHRYLIDVKISDR